MDTKNEDNKVAAGLVTISLSEPSGERRLRRASMVSFACRTWRDAWFGPNSGQAFPEL